MNVKDDTPAVHKEYAELAKEAQRLLDAKKYNECAHLLLGPLERLYNFLDDKEGEWRGNLKLYVLYCSAVIDGKLNQEYTSLEYSRTCKKFLLRLQKLEPDDIKWHSYWLSLESEELLKDFERIDVGDSWRLIRIESCLKKADYVIRRDAEIHGGENKDNLNLIKAQLLTAAWLLKGADKKWPDDYGDPGVYEREQAYSIASRYPNGKEFIALRIIIIDKMLTHSGLFNKYYFRGNVHYRNDELNNERSILKNRMGGF